MLGTELIRFSLVTLLSIGGKRGGVRGGSERRAYVLGWRFVCERGRLKFFIFFAPHWAGIEVGCEKHGIANGL